MFCTGCGVELRDNDRFCSQCGKPMVKPGEAPPSTPFSQRRLARPVREKTIGGVCAGFARYLDVDVVLMRIIWLCAALFTGLPLIAYLVCWIVMPADWGAQQQPHQEKPQTAKSGELERVAPGQA